MRAETLRKQLAQVAERRKATTVNMESVARDIRRLVAEAPDAGVPISEVARLLDMDRTSLYRTYINGNGSADGS